MSSGNILKAWQGLRLEYLSYSSYSSKHSQVSHQNPYIVLQHFDTLYIKLKILITHSRIQNDSIKRSHHMGNGPS